MTKRLKFGIILTLSFVFCMLFAVTAFAETYTVSYCNMKGDSKATATTDANGQITLRNTSVTTADGKVFYGWFTDSGDFYASGEKITLAQNIKLREAYAYVVTDYAGLSSYLNPSHEWSLVRIDADIVIDAADMQKLPGSTGNNGLERLYLDLNGHTISTEGSGKSLFYGSRTDLEIFNSSDTEGKIVANNLKATDAIFVYTKHGSADGNQIGISIAKNVRVETTGALFTMDRDLASDSSGQCAYCPNVKIYGTVVANSLVNANNKTTYFSNIDIYGDVTLTGTSWWTNPKKDYDVTFADFAVHDGARLTMTNPEFSWTPSDIYTDNVVYSITGGSFNVKVPDEFIDSHCSCVYNDKTGYYDVNYIMEIVVNDGGELKTLVVNVSDVYTINNSNLIGIKSFADPSDPSKIYSPSSIVKLVIPTGVEVVPSGAIKNLESLEEIVVLDGSNVTFETASIDTCVNLKKLTLGESTVVFKKFVVKSTVTDTAGSPSAGVTIPSCPNFDTIDATKANVTFGDFSFRFNGAIKHILLSSGHTYNFGQYAFHRSAIEEVILPDNSTVSLAIKAFAETKTLTYVYVGANCLTERVNGKVALGSDNSSSVLGGNGSLSKVVLMDVEYIGKWVLSVKTSGDYASRNDLYIYCHSDSLEFNSANSNSAINDRNAHNVYIYAKNIVNNPSNCHYVIYKGIPHKYTYTSTEPTCTTPGYVGHITDCPCGVSENATYTVSAYSNYNGDKNGGTITAAVETPATGHEFDPEKGATVVETIPATCLKGGTITYKCARCDETKTVDNENDPQKAHNVEGVEWTKISDLSCTTDAKEVKYCKTCNAEAESKVVEAQGHEFDLEDGATQIGMTYPNGFDKAGAILTKCARCAITSNTEVAPIFAAKGYSTNSTKTSIDGGYIVNTDLLALYESYNGAITYGVVIANANLFGENSFFNSENRVSIAQAIQVQINQKFYTNFNCTITNFGTHSSTLELVICAYVIDEDGNATFIQAENDYAVATTIGGQSFTKVTLDLVVANVIEQPDATTPPSNDEEN